MPAIDPDRLRKQVAGFAGAIGDPAELRRRALDILEFYADRTRRPGPSTHVDDVSPAFGVARPVMKSLTQALRRAAAGKPERGLAAAEALWQTGYREARLLAAALVGDQFGEPVMKWVESHARMTDDNIVLAELAGQSTAGWRVAEPGGFVDQLARWLDSSRRGTQQLAYLAMTSAVEDPRFHQLPRLFGLIAGRAGSVRGETRKALYRLLRALARRSPPETTHFLIAEVAGGDPAAIRMARNVIDSLPHDDAGRLRLTIPGGPRVR